MENELMTAKEVAVFLRYQSVMTIYNLVAQKKLPCIKLSGKNVKFRRSQIEAWLQEREQQVVTVQPAAPVRAVNKVDMDRLVARAKKEVLGK